MLQENKYKEAMSYYEPIVKEAGVQILTVTAIVLANLCVCYIMTNQVCVYNTTMFINILTDKIILRKIKVQV